MDYDDDYGDDIDESLLMSMVDAASLALEGPHIAAAPLSRNTTQKHLNITANQHKQAVHFTVNNQKLNQKNVTDFTSNNPHLSQNNVPDFTANSQNMSQKNIPANAKKQLSIWGFTNPDGKVVSKESAIALSKTEIQVAAKKILKPKSVPTNPFSQAPKLLEGFTGYFKSRIGIQNVVPYTR